MECVTSADITTEITSKEGEMQQPPKVTGSGCDIEMPENVRNEQKLICFIGIITYFPINSVSTMSKLNNPDYLSQYRAYKSSNSTTKSSLHCCVVIA